jgi:hypothetical protein
MTERCFIGPYLPVELADYMASLKLTIEPNMISMKHLLQTKNEESNKKIFSPRLSL